MHGKRILVVEDERAIRDMICFYLRCHDFAVSEADDEGSARRLLCEQAPNLILLERTLAASDGLELARSVRSSQRRWIPLLMIVGHASEEERVAALDAGVDDVVGKPFSPRELLARIHALLRRCEKHGPRSHDLDVGFTLDSARQCVMFRDSTVELTPTDFRLLTFFVENAERAHTRKELMKNVWGSGAGKDLRTVDVQIQRLRSALSSLSMQHLIQTVQGVGYRFSLSIDARSAGRFSRRA